MRKPISQWQIRYAFSDNKDSHDDFPNEARSGRTTATGGDTVIGTESTVGVMVRRLRALSLVLFGETSNADRLRALCSQSASPATSGGDESISIGGPGRSCAFSLHDSRIFSFPFPDQRPKWLRNNSICYVKIA